MGELELTPAAVIEDEREEVDMDVALQLLAKRIVVEQRVLYDGLEDSSRRAADVLIAGKAVQTSIAPGGFVVMRPLGKNVMSFLRGQVGEQSLLHRLAAGILAAE